MKKRRRRNQLSIEGGLKILIVKGNKFQAARAAADRGIPFVFKKETKGETVGYTRASSTVLNKWFIEYPYDAPFPVGTLLWWGYSEKERRKR